MCTRIFLKTNENNKYILKFPLKEKSPIDLTIEQTFNWTVAVFKTFINIL